MHLGMAVSSSWERLHEQGELQESFSLDGVLSILWKITSQDLPLTPELRDTQHTWACTGTFIERTKCMKKGRCSSCCKGSVTLTCGQHLREGVKPANSRPSFLLRAPARLPHPRTPPRASLHPGKPQLSFHSLPVSKTRNCAEPGSTRGKSKIKLRDLTPSSLD